MADLIIQADISRMECDNAYLNEKIELLKSRYQLIEEEKNKLTASWEGDSSFTYMTQLTNKLVQYQEVISWLEKVNQYEKTAISEYSKAEKKVRNIIYGMQ